MTVALSCLNQPATMSGAWGTSGKKWERFERWESKVMTNQGLCSKMP
jgi:hypothetical protein